MSDQKTSVNPLQAIKMICETSMKDVNKMLVAKCVGATIVIMVICYLLGRFRNPAHVGNNAVNNNNVTSIRRYKSL